MYIDKELEDELSDKVVRGLLWVMGIRWKEWEVDDVLVVCVSPDYSGMIGVRVLQKELRVCSVRCRQRRGAVTSACTFFSSTSIA